MAFWEQEGSGNNWAYGYNYHGKRVSSRIIELLRKQLEKCDIVDGIMVYQSLAGGTGSGVGSRLLQQIRESFPKTTIMSSVVLPRISGEVILQFYNSVFSLSTLYDECDGVFVFQNDLVKDICQKIYSIKNPDFNDLNHILSNQISSLMFPMVKNYGEFFYARDKKIFPLQNCGENLCRYRMKKLLGLKYVPQVIGFRVIELDA